MRRNNDIYDRTEKLLLNDKTKAIAGFNEVIKSDIYNMLENYFSMVKKSVSLDIDVDAEGIYSIFINAKAEGIKPLMVPKDLE